MFRGSSYRFVLSPAGGEIRRLRLCNRDLDIPYRFVPRRSIHPLSLVLGGEGRGEGPSVAALRIRHSLYRFVPRRSEWSRCPHRRPFVISPKPIAGGGTGSTCGLRLRPLRRYSGGGDEGS